MKAQPGGHLFLSYPIADTRLAGNSPLFKNSVRRHDLEFRHWSRFRLETRSIRTLTINKNTLSPKLMEICDLFCRTSVILYDKWGRIVVTGIFSPKEARQRPKEIDCSNESIFTTYLSCCVSKFAIFWSTFIIKLFVMLTNGYAERIMCSSSFPSLLHRS